MLVGDFMFALNDAMGNGWWRAFPSAGSSDPLVCFFRARSDARRASPSPRSTRSKSRDGSSRAWFSPPPIPGSSMRPSPIFHADVMTFYMAGPIYVAALSHFPAGRAARLAALAGGLDRLCRCRHRAPAFLGHALVAVHVRPCRRHVIRADVGTRPRVALDARCDTGDLANRGMPLNRRAAQHRQLERLQRRPAARSCCSAWFPARRIQ